MSKITNHSSETIRLNASLKSPFSIVYLPFIARVYRTAFRPRKRISKKLIGKPAKSLFRGLSFLGLTGTGIAQLQTPKGPKKIYFSGRNTQFGALYMPQSLPIYERETSALLLKLIKKDDVFFDIGANWGWYSILIGNQSKFMGKIHAFEPHPTNYSDLVSIVDQSNLKKRVKCHNLALAETSGNGKIAFSDGLQNGLARLGPVGVNVKLERLDNLRIPNPIVIKIDAEDHELGVLKGGANIIDKSRPFIIIENWLHDQEPQKTLLPLSFLAERDYCFFIAGWVDKDPNCIKTNSQVSSELALVPFFITQRFQMIDQINVFAVPRERIPELHRRLLISS